ncbi:MAG TPA: DMT family transporter [Castellaniella sp.]|uniref:DMT family transporter n=1 Tax=Castellaniella sp. TaxID=1955812 RepID=UPI002F0989E6
MSFTHVPGFVGSVRSASSATKGYLLIHFCVVLWGFTPIMGRVISLDAVSLVWWRMLLAALVLLFLPLTWRGIREMSWRVFAACCGAGVILAITWALFYLAVKLTNASVAAVCLGTAPLFIAIFGPLLTRRPYQRGDLILAVAIIPGVALVAGGIPHGMYLGLGVGLLSAATLTAFSGTNKLLANRTHPISATCVELAAGTLFLSVVLAVLPGSQAEFSFPHGWDIVFLLVFAVTMTALPMALLLVALRYITVFAQQMATNLEPVYAVLLAIPLLGEQQELGALFYLGVVMIIGTVMVEPLNRWLRTRSRRKS